MYGKTTSWRKKMKIVARDAKMLELLVDAFDLYAIGLAGTLEVEGLEIALDDVELDILIDGLQSLHVVDPVGYELVLIEKLLQALGEYDDNATVLL
ncbi:hypothetical protein SmaMPs15_000044 [Stenotrophomonas maltophilia phage vB_SmaM_Ps15]|uniref:Uncharacterized protein n=1 Tax=Stenotrophomonas maltophilia phage vB_SmaM_Ps15 TaxID=3071007 RepID=A0AAE9FLI3_9CAUD|nr:hypothetical protein PQC01_gp044 [Stenotrophomonas maltophilia phage vB_SmaM_Ps15]UMO77195.1 hypothetical protein SmaMPs15_000044 [Stenotrophomonas maltophilia phage vB_SmaM_Ps15]